MILNRKDYLNKVLGCWMGKNIGGTIGAPFEWRRQINDVSFYTQDLKGEALPNDDLDIQLLWLLALEERGVNLDAKTLMEYWSLHLTPYWAEYGTSKVNMRSGLIPPLSGSYKNDYKDSCGSFIRSEIWACIVPGCPAAAAEYAYEDAILDHGNGEGIYAEVFCATLESAAFVVSDLQHLIQVGLLYIPRDCGVTGAIQLAMELYKKKIPWKQARDEMLTQYRGSAFVNDPKSISKEDREKGFASGKFGWDVPSNIGMLLIALLYGEDDFGKTLCLAVNCGEDTDCTAATAGSIFGIQKGIGAIPQKWVDPIGRKIKTICLNVGDLQWRLPKDVDELTARTEKIALQALLRKKLKVEIAENQATDLSDLDENKLMSPDQGAFFYRNFRSPIFKFDFFEVALDYGEEPVLHVGKPKSLRATLRHLTGPQEHLDFRWYAPEGVRVSPSRGKTFVPPGHFIQNKPVLLDFEIEAGEKAETPCRLVLEFTIPGRPTVMLVPVLFFAENP